MHAAGQSEQARSRACNQRQYHPYALACIRSSELDPLLRQFEHERAQARAAAAEAADWERFLRCCHVPHPRQRVAVAEFLARMAEAAKESDSRDTGEAFAACEVGFGYWQLRQAEREAKALFSMLVRNCCPAGSSFRVAGMDVGSCALIRVHNGGLLCTPLRGEWTVPCDAPNGDLRGQEGGTVSAMHAWSCGGGGSSV